MVQRAGARRRAAISAQDCADSSSGVRPGRRPHEAWRAVRSQGRTEGLGWSVDAEGVETAIVEPGPRCVRYDASGSTREASGASWGHGGGPA